MPSDDQSLVGRLDRLGVGAAGARRGLPLELASHVAEIVTATGLREDRRVEVFRELVAHFQDGLSRARRLLSFLPPPESPAAPRDSSRTTSGW